MSPLQKKEFVHFFYQEGARAAHEELQTNGAKWNTIYQVADKVIRVVSVLLQIAFPLALYYLPSWATWGIGLPSLIILSIVQSNLQGSVEDNKRQTGYVAHSQELHKDYTINSLHPIGEWDLPAMDPKLKSDVLMKEQLEKKHPTAPVDLAKTTSHYDLEVTPYLQKYAARHFAGHHDLEEKWEAIREMNREAQREFFQGQGLQKWNEVVLTAYEANEAFHPQRDCPMPEQTTPSFKKEPTWEAFIKQRKPEVLLKLTGLKASHLFSKWEKTHPQDLPKVARLPRKIEAVHLDQILKQADKAMLHKNSVRVAVLCLPYLLIAAQAILALYYHTPWLFWGCSAATVLIGTVSQYIDYHLGQVDKEKQGIKLQKHLINRPDIERVPGTHPRLKELKELQKRNGLDGTRATWGNALGIGDETVAAPKDLKSAKDQMKKMAKEGSRTCEKYLQDKNILLKSKIRRAEADLDAVLETYGPNHNAFLESWSSLADLYMQYHGNENALHPTANYNLNKWRPKPPAVDAKREMANQLDVVAEEIRSCKMKLDDYNIALKRMLQLVKRSITIEKKLHPPMSLEYLDHKNKKMNHVSYLHFKLQQGYGTSAELKTKIENMNSRLEELEGLRLRNS